MIFVRLAGGLGNQLFQIAAAVHYSKHLNRPVSLALDALSFYKVHRDPLYSLVLPNSVLIKPLRRDDWIVKAFCNRIRIGKIPGFCGLSVNDDNFLKPQSYCANWPWLFMDGYFQSRWTSNHFYETISELKFASLDPLVATIPKGEVAVHVRGRDFLNDSKYSFLGVNYYLKCIRQALEFGYNEFVFITDDPQYCTSLASIISHSVESASFRVSSQSSVFSDFEALRTASARITGNSTFSWWATALSGYGPTWSTPFFAANHPKPFRLEREIFVV